MNSTKDTFKKMVEECRKNESPKTIFNASKDHALVLFQELFTASIEHKEDVKIISGHLDDSFYNDLSIDLESCVGKGMAVEVIVLNDRDLSSNKFAKIIQNSDRCSITQLPTGNKISSAHFILVGNSRFRAETDHDQAKAIASFNNPSVGETLTEIFASVKNKISQS